MIKENINLRNIIIIVVAIVIGIISFTTLAEKYSEPETYTRTIHSLDEKRNDVIAMSTASAAISTGLTIIPGDVAGPIADELANLSTTLMIVLAAIFLEKYMLVLTGLVSFKILIPLACILSIIFLLFNKEKCKIYIQ